MKTHSSYDTLSNLLLLTQVQPLTTTKLTIKATGRIFVGVRSKHASELQNDKKIELPDKEVFLPCQFKEHLHVKLKTADNHLMFGLLIMIKPHCLDV